MPPLAALACYGASWRKVEALGKPAWLADLHQMDRKRAERWLAEVGETRFLNIATAATARKKPLGRRPKDGASLVLFAAVYWLTHPNLDKRQAASAAAREFRRTQGEGTAFATIAFADTGAGQVQRIMSEGLADLSFGSLAAAVAETERLGLSIRADAMGKLPQCGPPTPAFAVTRFRFSALPSSPMAPFASKLEQLQAAHSKALARVLPSPARLAEWERTRHLLTALHGLIPDDTPMSWVSSLFSDMVAVLQKPEE